MTEIDFYTHSPQPYEVVAKLCAKAYTRGMQVRVLTRDQSETKALDRWLWQNPALSFLPHCALQHPLAPDTPILIGEHLEHQGTADLLINLFPEPPPFFARFLRLAEIVAADPESLAQGRAKYSYYRDRGYPIRIHRLVA